MDDEKKKKRNKKKKNKQNNSKRADGDAIPTEDGNHNGDADIALINQVPDSIELEPSSQQIIINVSWQCHLDPRNITLIDLLVS